MNTGRIKRGDQAPRLILPRAGFIKTGTKNEKGHPISTDYFIATGKYAGFFEKAYGPKPQLIHVVFLSDEPAEVCNEELQYWDKDGRLYAYGDGEEFHIWDGKKYAVRTETTTPGIQEKVTGMTASHHGWQTVLTLRFLLPKVSGIAGYWQFTTRAEKSTIPNLIGTFDMMKENRGFVKGIIFDLTVEFATSQKPGVKSRYPVVNLIPNVSQENIDLVRRSLVKTDTARLLDPGSDTKQLPEAHEDAVVIEPEPQTTYERCQICEKEWDEKEIANQACRTCGWSQEAERRQK